MSRTEGNKAVNKYNLINFLKTFIASLYIYKREIELLMAGYIKRGIDEYNREAKAE